MAITDVVSSSVVCMVVLITAVVAATVGASENSKLSIYREFKEFSQVQLLCISIITTSNKRPMGFDALLAQHLFCIFGSLNSINIACEH